MRNIVLVFLCGIAIQALAGPNHMTGGIVCADGTPVVGCKVVASVKGANGSASGGGVTDANGNFDFIIIATIDPPSTTTFTAASAEALVCMGFRRSVRRADAALECHERGREDRRRSLFHGTNSYATSADRDELDFLGACPNAEAFTIGFWIKTTQSSGVAIILDKRELIPGGLVGWSVFISHEGRWFGVVPTSHYTERLLLLRAGLLRRALFGGSALLRGRALRRAALLRRRLLRRPLRLLRR